MRDKLAPNSRKFFGAKTKKDRDLDTQSQDFFAEHWVATGGRKSKPLNRVSCGDLLAASGQRDCCLRFVPERLAAL